MNDTSAPDLILENAKITTLDRAKPEATSLVVKNGRIVGVDDAEEYQRGPDTKVIDLQGRRVIPGCISSAAALATTSSFAGTVFRPSRTDCACSKSRLSGHRPANGSASSAVGASSNSPNVVCPRLRKSTPSPPKRLSSSCTCIAAVC